MSDKNKTLMTPNKLFFKLFYDTAKAYGKVSLIPNKIIEDIKYLSTLLEVNKRLRLKKMAETVYYASWVLGEESEKLKDYLKTLTNEERDFLDSYLLEKYSIKLN